jgi:glucokinase
VTAVLSVDVGGTKTVFGAIAFDGTVRGETLVPTRIGSDDVLRVAELTAVAAAEHRPSAIAIGFPEYVDPQGALTSSEVLSWTEQPAAVVRAALTAHGFPLERIVIESDVRLGALGESVFGAGLGASSFLYISLGTGLSSAFVVNGEVWRGTRGEAIGFGEFRAPTGNLESYVSGAGVQDRYFAETGQRCTGREIVARANTGDSLAHRLLVSAGVALGDALSDIVAVLDPARVILGGGWGTADTPLVSEALTRYAVRSGRRPDACPVVGASLGFRSGLLGGGVAAFRAVTPRFGY